MCSVELEGDPNHVRHPFEHYRVTYPMGFRKRGDNGEERISANKGKSAFTLHTSQSLLG